MSEVDDLMDRFMDLNRPIKQFVEPKMITVVSKIEDHRSSQTMERTKSGKEYSYLELEKEKTKLKMVNHKVLYNNCDC